METKLPSECIRNNIFLNGFCCSGFDDREVDDDILFKICDLTLQPPTNFHSSPIRIIFIKSRSSKDSLLNCIPEKHKNLIDCAPVTAIIAFDTDFVNQATSSFNGHDFYKKNPELLEAHMVRNGDIQGAYFILAVRSLGLECNPLSEFDNMMVDEIFFKDLTVKSNFLVSLGYPIQTPENSIRLTQLSFEDSCIVLQ